MTASIAKYFLLRDACFAAGGVLADLGRAMDSAVISGLPIEQELGCFGRWRLEARQVFASRTLEGAMPNRPRRGDYSECARRLRAQLIAYRETRFDGDLIAGSALDVLDADLFKILAKSSGRVPSDRVLRRRFSQVGRVAA